MREIRHIITAQKEAVQNGKKTVLATVVHVEGSSYRGPGARMLVTEEGITTGAISGGCLEGDALRKALNALVQNQNKLITYDTNDEEDAVIGAQLGCNGVIQVLFEPVDVTNPENPVALLEKVILEKRPSILVTLFNRKNKQEDQVGTSLLLEEHMLISGSLEDAGLKKQILSDIPEVYNQKHSLFREYIYNSGQQNVFMEYFSPPVSLVIVGAGNDTQVLARMADILGWDIQVVDGRPTHAKKERFVSSCQVIVSRPEAILESISINEQTAFALMTHNYNYDLQVLKCLIDIETIPYIGILGPKKKFNRMLEDLHKEGITLSESQLKKIYAPTGLEIGAETPEEIGLSVLAEIQAVLTRTKGGFLREKQEPIHSKSNTQFDVTNIEHA